MPFILVFTYVDVQMQTYEYMYYILPIFLSNNVCPKLKNIYSFRWS